MNATARSVASSMSSSGSAARIATSDEGGAAVSAVSSRATRKRVAPRRAGASTAVKAVAKHGASSSRAPRRGMLSACFRPAPTTT